MALNFNIICEVILGISILLITYTILLSPNNLDSSFNVVIELMKNWKSKPLDTIQISKFRTCNELKMTDLLNYKFPGNNEGCICKGYTKKNCNKIDFDTGCIKISPSNPQIVNRWKGHYICGSIIKNKNYFELSKSENKKCFQKHKLCGVLDTLGNYLCSPDNEQCPINKLNIRKQSDENNFNLESNNSNYNGKIITSFSISEGYPCFIPSQKVNSLIGNELLSDTKTINNNINNLKVFNNNNNSNSNFKLDVTNYNDELVSQCMNSYYIDNNYEYNHKVSLTDLDDYLLSDFFKSNKLDIYKATPSSQLKLFSSYYIGWKKTCETSGFNSFFKLTDYKEEINKINDLIETYNTWFTKIAIIIFLCFIFSSYLKNKVNIKDNFSIVFLICHLPILICSIATLFLSNAISNQIKESKNTSQFFEMISSKDCSDDHTNSELRTVAKEFYDLNDKYFNLKLLSCVVIFFMVVVYIVPLKNRFERLRKKSTLDQYNKIA